MKTSYRVLIKEINFKYQDIRGLNESLINNKPNTFSKMNKSIRKDTLLKQDSNESCGTTLGTKRSSKKERRVDALALRAEERRDKLRKAVGRCK